MDTPFQFTEADRDSLELVQQIILYRLKNDKNWSQFDHNWDPRSNTVVTFDDRNLHVRFLVLANEVMWRLIIQGVITPGSNLSNPNLPFFRITDYGHKVLQEERFIPHDPTGYLDELHATFKTISGDVPIAYAGEALRCFTTGCNVASVLLLGVAAESVFLQLCDIVSKSIKDTARREKFDKLPNHVRPRHKWIVAELEKLPRKTRNSISESLDVHISSLYELIRRQRNDAGHPQKDVPDIGRDLAFTYFKLFPSYVQDVEALAQYCATNGF